MICYSWWFFDDVSSCVNVQLVVFDDVTSCVCVFTADGVSADDVSADRLQWPHRWRCGRSTGPVPVPAR